MTDIHILQTGCAGCRKVEQLLTEILSEAGMRGANIGFLPKDKAAGVGSRADMTPLLEIDGDQVWVCSPPTKEQLLEWLYQASVVTVI